MGPALPGRFRRCDLTLLFTGKGNEGGVRVVLVMANDFELSWFSFFNCDGLDSGFGVTWGLGLDRIGTYVLSGRLDGAGF